MKDSPILGKYHTLERLGAGAHGLVYRAANTNNPSDTSTQYAIKLERASKKKRRPPSEHEATVLQILADTKVSPLIPRMIEYGYDKGTHSQALVLDLLGTDLQTLRKECGGRFSIKTTLMLATRLIPTIRYIHSKGFVHRDIKPGNMLMGPKGRETSVYIIDFGISRRYMNPSNKAHMPFLNGKSVVGTVRYTSLNTHLGIAQTRRDDIECLAYSLLDCLRDLPWGNITGGSPKQFEDRVREKKRSWTPERLCSGVPNSFRLLLSHARQLKFDEEPDYDGLQKAFVDDMKQHEYAPDAPFDWSDGGDAKDFAPPMQKEVSSSRPVTESVGKLLDAIRPGDFIKVKLLGLPTVQFSGRFNSIDTDHSFWQSPSLAGKEWEFPYRPAIVASLDRDVVVRKGKKGMTLSVYPLMRREGGLGEFPENIRRRYIPLDASTSGTDSRTPQVEPEWTLGNTYIYNTCVTLTVSVDSRLLPDAEILSMHWRLKSPSDLMKVDEQLKAVRPPLEAGQEIQPEDGAETKGIKKDKHHILQTVFAEIAPLALADSQSQELMWAGRNGWLREYNQISRRREAEREGSEPESSEEYDSDYIYDSICPPGERRKSCTVNLDASDFK